MRVLLIAASTPILQQQIITRTRAFRLPRLNAGQLGTLSALFGVTTLIPREIDDPA
jgi:hypothetical protein